MACIQQENEREVRRTLTWAHKTGSKLASQDDGVFLFIYGQWLIVINIQIHRPILWIKKIKAERKTSSKLFRGHTYKDVTLVIKLQFPFIECCVLYAHCLTPAQ